MTAIAEPILILAMPRTGSSMTAGIFAKHGVWTGECRPGANRNPKGFFEGVAIKQALMQMHKAIVNQGKLAERKPGFRQLVENLIIQDGYKGGSWLWKGSAMYWPAWFEFSPKYVVCRRDKESTFHSCRAAPRVFGSKLTDLELRSNIEFHHQQMDSLVKDYGAVEVDTKAVANGDYETIKNALEHCGIEFDLSVTDEFVDPRLWHYG